MSLALRGTVVGDRGKRLHAHAGRAEPPTQRRSLDRRLAKIAPHYGFSLDASPPAREDVLELGRARARGENEEAIPGWITVLPRGGIVSAPRATTAISALRGRPSSRTAEPGDRVVSSDVEFDELERTALIDFERRRGDRGPRVD